MRPLILSALLITGCTSVAPIHELRGPIPPGRWAWCMLPGGELTGWSSGQGVADPHPYGTCAAPARFVIVPVCGPGQVPPDETPATFAARARLSRDNMLVGDSFEGRPFCAPTPPS